MSAQSHYQVKITFDGPLLGTAPTNPQLYTDYIVEKAVANGVNGVADEWDTMPTAEDVERQTRGLTAFHRNSAGQNILYNYMIRGFFKEMCGHLWKVPGTESSKLKAYKKRIDGWVFVEPRQVPIKLSGPVTILERPLRAETPQGPRVALTSSAMIPAGSTAEFRLKIINGKEITLDLLTEWLDFGQNIGLGQWRSSSFYGTFTYQIETLA